MRTTKPNSRRSAPPRVERHSTLATHQVPFCFYCGTATVDVTTVLHMPSELLRRIEAVVPPATAVPMPSQRGRVSHQSQSE